MAAQFLESAAGAIFHASWQAGVLAIVVLVACRVFPRLPPAARSWLWLIVLARLLFPITPQSGVSLFNVVTLARSTLNPVPDAPVPDAKEISVASGEEDAKPAFAAAPRYVRAVGVVHNLGARTSVTEPSATPSETSVREFAVDRPTPVDVPTPVTLTGIVAGLWAVGALLLLTRCVFSWIRLRRFLASCLVLDEKEPRAVLEKCRLEARVRRKVELLMTDLDVAPALAGILLPRIVLSTKTLAAVSSAELEWLFRHELAHVKRWDVAVQLLWRFVRAMYWFNPLVWWAASRARIDAEMACDALAVERATVSEHLAYGGTLLKVAELLIGSTRLPATVGISLGEPVLSRRIRAIASYRRPSRTAKLVVGSLLICLSGVGLTDAIENRAVAADPSSEQAPPSPLSQPSLQPGERNYSPVLARVFAAWKARQERIKTFHFVWDTRIELPKGAFRFSRGAGLAGMRTGQEFDGGTRLEFTFPRSEWWGATIGCEATSENLFTTTRMAGKRRRDIEPPGTAA